MSKPERFRNVTCPKCGQAFRAEGPGDAVCPKCDHEFSHAALAERTQQEALTGAEVWERVQRVLNHPNAKQRTGEQLGESILMSLGPIAARPTSAADCTAPMQPSALAVAKKALEEIHNLSGGECFEYREIALHALASLERLAAPTQAAPAEAVEPAAQSDLPPPDSAYWVNHDVASPYTERAKPADTPYNLGWMSGWAAHGRAYPEQAAPAAQAVTGGEAESAQGDFKEDAQWKSHRGPQGDYP